MINFTTVRLKNIDSTNTYAKVNAEKLHIPSLITAEKQTSGRGRQGKSFYSPDGTGLYMTVLFDAPPDCSLLTPLAAVAVCEELEKIGAIPKIKWVNDIFVNNRKVCGILTECFSANGKTYIALGVGINLTTSVFPDDLEIAGSIDIDCDKDLLSQNICRNILSHLHVPAGEIIEKYREKLFVIGKDIVYTRNNVEYEATVEGINENCNLIVKHPDGTFYTLSSGEISIRL